MSHRTDKDTPGLLQDLLERIHREHLNDQQAERSRHFKRTRRYLILFALSILGIQIHTAIYNAIAGPFHLNREQLATHLHTRNQNLSLSSLLHWFSLREEYLQIDIGENQLERNRSNVLHVFDKGTRNTTLATMHPIEDPTIADALDPDRFFITLASDTKSRSLRRHPYRFPSFTLRTLRCAVRQLGVRPSDYITWVEKSFYVQIIEKHYEENATLFNTVVAPACGMLLGCVYRKNDELAYLPYSESAYVFRHGDIYFAALLPYDIHAVLAFVGIMFGWLLLKSRICLRIYLAHWFRPCQSVLSPDVRAQLNELSIDSLQALDTLLSALSEQRHFHHRLFVIQERYLMVLQVDWNEPNPQTLATFYTRSPFTVYAVALITKVLHNGFWIRKGEKETWIPFPTAMRATDDKEADWLHGQMVSISEEYRQLADAEEHRQQVNLGRMSEGVASASPRFIANFRFDTHPEVLEEQAALLSSECSVCMDKFEIGQAFARWPCPGQHAFHHRCMLDTLRVTNQCPLCRHEVDAAPIPDRNVLFELMSREFFL